MKVQAEVSVYPLREQHLSESVAQFRHTMDSYGLAVKTGAMSTKVAGDSGDLFRGLGDAFEQLVVRESERRRAVRTVLYPRSAAHRVAGGRLRRAPWRSRDRSETRRRAFRAPRIPGS